MGINKTSWKDRIQQSWNHRLLILPALTNSSKDRNGRFQICALLPGVRAIIHKLLTHASDVLDVRTMSVWQTISPLNTYLIWTLSVFVSLSFSFLSYKVSYCVLCSIISKKVNEQNSKRNVRWNSVKLPLENRIYRRCTKFCFQSRACCCTCCTTPKSANTRVMA